MLLSVLPFAMGAAGAIGASGAYYATYGVRSQWLGRTVWHGRQDTEAVAITFDDGPSPDTPAILDTLAEQGVKATFFALGHQVKKYPNFARRIVDEGHEIGNHSDTHPIFLFRGAHETRRQLERTQEIIFNTTGQMPKLSRPPCGVRSPAYFRAAKGLGLRTINWSIAGMDWKGYGPARIAKIVLKAARPGSIILLHDGDSAGRASRRATVESLPLIFAGLGSKGLRVDLLENLCAVDEIIEPTGKSPNA